MVRVDASAVILAGGRSSRMGQPKPALRLGEGTLIERIVAQLRRAFDDIVIVTAPEAEAIAMPELASVTIVHDPTAYAGPVGALARGLRAARHGMVFACSCDLPMLRAEVALWMVSLLDGRRKYDAAIVRIDGRLQPLHAAYRGRCAGALEAMVGRGEYHLSAVVESVNARIVDEVEYLRHDPDAFSCFNINTPADYALALKLVAPAGPQFAPYSRCK